MEKLINLQSYPLHQLDSAAGQQLVAQCVDDLERKGMFTLKGFMRREVIDEILPGGPAHASQISRGSDS